MIYLSMSPDYSAAVAKTPVRCFMHQPGVVNCRAYTIALPLTQMVILEKRKNAFVEGTVPVFNTRKDFVSCGASGYDRTLFVRRFVHQADRSNVA